MSSAKYDSQSQKLSIKQVANLLNFSDLRMSSLKILNLNSDHVPWIHGDSLQGIPWNDEFCILDAIALMTICIAGVSEDEYRGGEKGVRSATLGHVIEAVLALVKTPWRDRTKKNMREFRDNIRSSLRRDGATIGKKTILEDSDMHIIPPWLIEFTISVEIRCEQCQTNGICNEYKRSGLSFCARDTSLAGFANLQDVLNYIVYSF